MNKKEFEYELKLESLRHENKLQEIEAEKLAKIKVETIKHDCDLEKQRIRNADIKRSIAHRELASMRPRNET